MKKLLIAIIIVEVITIMATVTNLFLTANYLEKPKNTTNNNTNTTVVLVQEEQEMSVSDIVKKEPDADVYIPEKYKAFVTKLCKDEDVPLYVFAKLIQSESRWIPKTVRTNYVYDKNGEPVRNKDGSRKIHSYDKGIAQLNTLNYDEFRWRFNENVEVDPFNINMSLTISCRYLSWLYDRTHSWYDACCAYKCGLSKVRIENVPLHIQEISKAINDPKISALDEKYFN